MPLLNIPKSERRHLTFQIAAKMSVLDTALCLHQESLVDTRFNAYIQIIRHFQREI